MKNMIVKTLFISSTIFTSNSLFAAPILSTHLSKADAFGVSSTLIKGEKDVILVNAKFTRAEALRVAANILDSGKNLKTIFVSYGDPDFYFGLETLKQLFPKAEVIATAETVKHIQDTHASKLKYWGPQLGHNAPTKIIVPTVFKGKTLTLDQDKIEIRGQKELTYLWIPSAKAVLGGIAVTSGSHLWMADTPKTADRQAVINTLESIKALKPEVVIPAHSIEGAAQGLEAVQFSIDYLKQYEDAHKKTKTSTELSERMQQLYPELEGADNLDFGAKVVKGEMKWP